MIRLPVWHRPSARWGVFGLAVGGLLLVSLWLRFTAPPPSPAQSPRAAPTRPGSIVVLPFINASPDTANDLISEGMTDELTVALGTLPGLRVIGWSSAVAFRDSLEDPREVGRRLGVEAVVEGSVRRSPQRIRVTARLLSVSQGFDLWSEAYERNPADLVAVEDDIAEGVAGTLRLASEIPGPLVRRLAAAPTGYTAYLAGRRELHRRDPASVLRAISLFGQAVQADSDFAPSWAGLAAAYVRRAVESESLAEDVMPLARAAVDRALTLDSTLAEAHGTLAQVLFLYDWDWRAAEQAFRRSLALNPNLPETHRWRARELMALGRIYDALDESRRALELSPLDAELRLQLVARYLEARQYVLARETLRRAIPADSSAPGPYYHVALLAAASEKYPEALMALRRPMTDSPDSVVLEAERARLLALAGRRDEALQSLRGLEQLRHERYLSPYLLATVAAALGDNGRAFRWLDVAARERVGRLVDARVDPRLAPLRSDRRFAGLLSRLGMP